MGTMGEHPRRFFTSPILAVSLFVTTALLSTCAVEALAQGRRASVGSRSATAGETELFLFNLVPGGTYDMSRNGSPRSTQDASYAGAVIVVDNLNTGDRLSWVLNGVNIVPPSRPTGVTASGDDTGCATVAWNRNPENDVVSYTIYYGPSLGTYVDSVVVGRTTRYNICGLTTGTYHFAIRARNGYGVMSALSGDASASVTNGNTQGPVPPQQVTLSESEPGSIRVTWQPSGEQNIAGYVVYFGPQSVARGEVSDYAQSRDVGNAVAATIEALEQGTYFVAVRSYTDGLEFSGFSTEKNIEIVGVDLTAPLVGRVAPAAERTGVPTNTAIFFVVSDTQTGVDPNTIEVRVNGQPATNLSVVGDDARSYSVRVSLNSLPANSTVAIEVLASDRAPTPNPHYARWTFATGDGADVTAPSFCCENPPPGREGVDITRPVRFGANDAGTGIDPTSIEFLINGTPATYTLEGSNEGVLVTHPNTEPFVPGSTVRVQFSVSDLSIPPNTASADYTFVAASALDAAHSGVIMPDGYWAGDPYRPMEVRDLPSGWTVRIFDTSGFQVKSHRNSSPATVDWAWDFTNDHGHRVAKALYLVRVVDEGGDVMQSGRFLVQGD